MESKYAIISLVAIAAVLLGSTVVAGANVEAKSKNKTYRVYTYAGSVPKNAKDAKVCFWKDGHNTKQCYTVNLSHYYKAEDDEIASFIIKTNRKITHNDDFLICGLPSGSNNKNSKWCSDIEFCCEKGGQYAASINFRGFPTNN